MFVMFLGEFLCLMGATYFLDFSFVVWALLVDFLGLCLSMFLILVCIGIWVLLPDEVGALCKLRG